MGNAEMEAVDAKKYQRIKWPDDAKRSESL